jgi:diguanylate cyclase (GGDEF)-like protein
MNLLLAISLTFIFIIVINGVRFMLSPAWNRALFCVSLLSVIIVSALIINDQWLSLALFIFVVVSAFSYATIGGVSAAIVALIAVMLLSPSLHTQDYIILFAGYAAVGILSSNYARFLAKETERGIAWQTQLFRQAKELNIVRSIGSALQGTLELDRILHIILTGITAGHGLGYNRAMLFLLSDDGKSLQGQAAIGSLRAEDVIHIWKITTRERMTMEDYIEQQKGADKTNQELIEFIRGLEIALDEHPVLDEALRHCKPVVLNTEHDVRMLNQRFGDQLDISELGIVPLLNHGEAIGVIVVDNHVSGQSFGIGDLQRILPLANQAAMAIYNANLYHKTQEMAITDGLTGLHNQRFFEEMLNTIYNSTRKHQMPLSMLVIDIDFFKNYNDTNGHLAGNDLLIQLASLLRQSVRKEDLTFRFGGEEFVVLLSSTKKADALRIAEKLRQQIEATVFPHEETQPNQQLTVSIGVSSFPDDKSRPRELFAAADSALYEAKKRGRNQVVAYEEGAPWSI